MALRKCVTGVQSIKERVNIVMVNKAVTKGNYIATGHCQTTIMAASCITCDFDFP
jgi:hypothetical protein